MMLSAARTLLDPSGKIVCLNVLHDVPAPVAMHLPADIVPQLKSNARETLEKAADAAGAPVEIHVVTGHPPTAILEAADTYKADLIIVGSHKPGFEDYLIGSTASRVLRHAKCSVLVQR